MKKLDISQVNEIFLNRGYKLLSDFYKGDKEPLLVECPAGHQIPISLHNFKQGKGCKYCSKKQVLNHLQQEMSKEIKLLIKERGYTLLNNYTNAKDFLHLRCSCGNEFKMRASAFKEGQNCPKCIVYGRKSHSQVEVQSYFAEYNYKLLDAYTKMFTPLHLICPQGHDIHMTYNNFKNHGHRCATCSRSVRKPSFAQQEILNYVKSLITEDINFNDRHTIAPLELDIYIPSKHFAIEFDGLYWHSSKVKENYNEINIRKYNACKEKDINLLVIYEDEWAHKQELIKAMIRNRLKTQDVPKIRASKCELKKLEDSALYKDFFKEYHLDGNVNSSYAYGLYYKEELISCMSFRHNKYHDCWEIARFATNYNFVIYGNASKLLSQITDKLVTYSNNRLSHGDVYYKLGFKEITQTYAPSYWYTDGFQRIFRTKCQRVKDPSILAKYPTEIEQALGGIFSAKYLGHNKPLYRIYDYGHRKWIRE